MELDYNQIASKQASKVKAVAGNRTPKVALLDDVPEDIEDMLGHLFQ